MEAKGLVRRLSISSSQEMMVVELHTMLAMDFERCAHIFDKFWNKANGPADRLGSSEE